MSLSPQMGQLPTIYKNYDRSYTLVVNPKGQSPVIKDEDRPDPAFNGKPGLPLYPRVDKSPEGNHYKSEEGFANLQANLGLIKLNAQVKTQGTPYEGMIPVYRGAEEELIGPSKFTGVDSEGHKSDFYEPGKETETLQSLQEKANTDPENAVPNKTKLGIHWTTDYDVAKNFSLANDESQTQDGDGPFRLGKGLVYEGYVHPDDIKMPSTDNTVSKDTYKHNKKNSSDMAIWGNDNTIPDDTQYDEKEITVNPGRKVTLTALHHLEPTGYAKPIKSERRLYRDSLTYDLDNIVKSTRVPLSRQIQGNA
jgi:hypothetical protein